MGGFAIEIGGEPGSSDLIPEKVMFQPADTRALSAADQPKKSAHDILMISAVLRFCFNPGAAYHIRYWRSARLLLTTSYYITFASDSY